MKVYVDPDKCQGHTRCNALAPEIFELREDDGHSYVKFADNRVPAGLEEKARRAAETCPESAIRIEEA